MRPQDVITFNLTLDNVETRKSNDLASTNAHNRMDNINFTINNSYQQYCKQEAQAREYSRHLLLHIQQFEYTSLQLTSDTQLAQVDKDTYEKLFIQQNPMLWARIQRVMATGHLHSNNIRMPLFYSTPKTEWFKEAHIEPRADSSVSELLSDREDGVWRRTPSPHPAVEGTQSEIPKWTAETQSVSRNSQISTKRTKEPSREPPASTFIDFVAEEPTRMIVKNKVPLLNSSLNWEPSQHQPSAYKEKHTVKNHLQYLDCPFWAPISSGVGQGTNPAKQKTDWGENNSPMQNVEKENVAPENNLHIVEEDLNARTALQTPEAQVFSHQTSLSTRKSNPISDEVVQSTGSTDESTRFVELAVRVGQHSPSLIMPDVEIKPNLPERKIDITPISSLPSEPKTMKPFRLDSDSESTVSATMSGPSAPAEDSDSFWN